MNIYSTNKTKLFFLSHLFTVCLAWVFSPLVWATPDQDPFYFAQPIPGNSSGDIIDVRQSKFTIDPLFLTPYPGVNAWQIMFQSENATGKVIAVSGTVLVPEKSWNEGERPIIGYSTGTRGLADACAPSYTLSQGYDYESPTIISLLEEGWAVVISDYEGLGTPGDHTYMVGPSQGRVALDVIRAAQSLPEAGLSPNASVVLMGYSQGGGASSWASELASTYAPEINIIAAVPGGVPADLEATGRFLDGTAFAGFALIASVGLNAAYDEINLAEILNEDGLELLEKSGDMCLVGSEELDAKLGTAFSRFTDYALFNPVDDPTWQYYMALSKLGKVAPKFPVYMYHGIIDMIVPYAPAEELRRDWCRLGAVVEWHPTFDVHVSALFSGPSKAIKWIANRIAGEPVYGNCRN